MFKNILLYRKMNPMFKTIIRNFSKSRIRKGHPYRPTEIVPCVKQGGYMIYKKVSFIMLPILLLIMVNCFALSKKKKEQPEFIPYEHLRLRTKRFPWGEGNKSLFHNKKTNPLPDGYEDEDD